MQIKIIRLEISRFYNELKNTHAGNDAKDDPSSCRAFFFILPMFCRFQRAKGFIVSKTSFTSKIQTATTFVLRLKINNNFK